MELKSMVNFIYGLVSIFFANTKLAVNTTAQEATKASLKDTGVFIRTSIIALCSTIFFLVTFMTVFIYSSVLKLISKRTLLFKYIELFKSKVILTLKGLIGTVHFKLIAIVNKTKAILILLVEKTNKIKARIISYATKCKNRLASFCTTAKQTNDYFLKTTLLTLCKVTRLILEKVVYVKKLLIETCNSIKSFDISFMNCTFIREKYRIIRPIYRFIDSMTPIPVYKREPDS